MIELLHGWEDAGQVSAPHHRAEQVVLWSLSAALESVMQEPFDVDYGRLVFEARARLTPSD